MTLLERFPCWLSWVRSPHKLLTKTQNSVKPFWPLLLTFVLPRAINYLRVVRTAVNTRPPTRPLPEKTARGLNVLFVSAAMFLLSSLLPHIAVGGLETRNVFALTRSRWTIPTDVLFSRLAMTRPDGLLTAADEALRSKLTSPTLRQLYLRFGPSTMVGCQFCHPDDPLSHLLFHLPTNVLLPHLLGLLCMGLATSESVAGFEAGRWRFVGWMGTMVLAALDIGVTSTYTATTAGGGAAAGVGNGLFWLASILRPLSLCLFHAAVAFLIWASSTHRFLLFGSVDDDDADVVRHRTERLLNKANINLQVTHANLRASSIVRNAVVRDPTLKQTDDDYWRTVVAMEGTMSGTDDGVFDDDEVQAAISHAYGSGRVDVSTMRREAEAFVRHTTRGLDGDSTR